MTIVSEETSQLIHHEPPAPAGHLAPGGELRQSIRDKIVARTVQATTVVRIDEWDVDIQIRSLTLGERNGMLQSIKDAGDGEANLSIMYPEIIARTCYDPETGEKVFGPDDGAFINNLPADLMDKLATPAMELSGMTDKAVDKAGKGSSQTDSSESVSPSVSGSDAP